MSKLSLLPLLLVTGIGAVWASTLIFPNTTEFPRSPGGVGTIRGALAFFDPTDGTAINTDKLNGVTASGYLQTRDCSGEPINKVWVGIDADGQARCGSRTVQLAVIGKFTEIAGNVQVQKNGATIWSNAVIGDDLTEGDILRTDGTGTGTVRFALDESILRLDTDTTVELSVGQLSGQSVAQAILTDGRLWGRILSSTGVNLGGGGLVAGVRGTSVSITKNNITVSIAIIDSQHPIAATIQNSDNSLTTGNTVSSGTLLSFTSGASTPVAMPTRVSQSRSTVFTDSWARQNTIADINMMTLALDSPTRPQGDRITTELAVTIPTDLSLLNQLTNTTEGQGATYLDDTEIISSSTNIAGSTPTATNTPQIRGKKFGCKIQGKRYWTSSDKCEDKNLVAFLNCPAPPSSDIPLLYYRTGSINATTYNKGYSLTGLLNLSGSILTLSGTTQAGTRSYKINQGNSPTTSLSGIIFGETLYLSGNSYNSSCGNAGYVHILTQP